MQNTRYNSVAISLHWLIAIVLIGLVALGKVMNSLEADDPFRFDLIQWHKSFGILALLLILVRLFWRLTHRPPSLPDSIKRLEKLAASVVHIVLYVLMAAIALSGWAMVSASPLNLKTELFGVIPWPHLPWFEQLQDKAALTEQLVSVHHLLAQVLIVIVLLHVVAALRHHFLLKDNVLSRMWMSSEHGVDRNHGIVIGGLIACAGLLYLTNTIESNTAESLLSRPLATAADDTKLGSATVIGTVGFTATQLGEPIEGVFKDSSLDLYLDVEDIVGASLTAAVQTASVSTGDGQIDSTVVTQDWFASDAYPTAVFDSTSIEKSGEDEFEVSGTLTIRAIVQPISFLMKLSGEVAVGEFLIDRTAFDVGVGGQDEFVSPDVTIRFEVSNQVLP